MASQAFGAVQDVGADREAGITSVATVLGARQTVWLALGLYVVSAVLLLAGGPAVRWTALLVLPYLAMAWPFRAIRDADCARANQGWKRFLWINYAVGAALTVGVLTQLMLL